jgi:hypothetical protein
MTTKIHVKDLRKITGDVNINTMFEEMMGVKDAELDIIIPKYVFIRNTLRHIYRVFIQFYDIISKDFPTYEQSLLEIKQFAEEFKNNTNLVDCNVEEEYKYYKMSKIEMNTTYRKLKEDVYVKKLIVMCSKLNRYSSNFSDINALKLNFVNQEPGLSFQIFDFSTLDLKSLWAQPNIKDSVKKYILLVFCNLHKHSKALYKCITSPDIDIEKFTTLLINAISEMKKQPKLNRCNAAFKKIEQSVELLKNNFENYYRESVASENSDLIVMNFITDVSNKVGNASASLTREFRTIITYMHEMSQKSGKNKDPNVQKIFKMLNNNFSIMENETDKPSEVK